MSTPLFAAQEEIGARVAQAAHVLLCLDFDGTLTPFKPDPRQCRLAPSLAEALRNLADRPDVSVAIISGRERADLQACIGIPGLIYAGNHGMEISGPGRLFVEPTAAAHGPELKELAAGLTQ